MPEQMRVLSPDTPAEAWHAPAGEGDLPCVWSIARGRLSDVLTSVRKLPPNEHQDIFLTIDDNTDVLGPEWPYLPFASIRLEPAAA